MTTLFWTRRGDRKDESRSKQAADSLMRRKGAGQGARDEESQVSGERLETRRGGGVKGGGMGDGKKEDGEERQGRVLLQDECGTAVPTWDLPGGFQLAEAEEEKKALSSNGRGYQWATGPRL
ncbi:hypothetical protein FDECE_11319, partial [Fusarium decemcellulare]